MSNDQTTTETPVTKSSGWFSALPSLVIPICLGLSAYYGLQYLINEQKITNETVLRYINGHPVSRLTVGMFLVGLASLMLIAFNVFAQFSREPQTCLDDSVGEEDNKPEPGVGVAQPEPAAGEHYGPEDADVAVDHGEYLMGLSKSFRHDYLWNRLVNSLHFIFRTGTVAGVEEEMKYLAEIDIERQQQRYSLSRILIWATPMLGFLGTVLGISQALGGISVGPDNDFQQMMGGLQSSLYVAFDTTALALTLSMVLMFCQFLVDRFEVQLLELVDQKTRREISRQFDLSVAGGAAGGMGATGLQVLEATRDVVRNQTEIWRDSIKAAENAWSSSLTQTSDLVRENLSEALDENVSNLAHYLGESIEKADQSIAHRWEQWQTLLSNNARLLKQHQDSLLLQTEKMQSVVDKVDDSATFKTAMEHQHQAVEATTKMHDVLMRVADEVSSQSKELHKQGSSQSQLLEKSSAAILKTQKVFEQRIENFKQEMEQRPLLQPVTQSGSDSEASQSSRRRKTGKPVMFLSSQAVTEIREKTQSAPSAKRSPSPPEVTLTQKPKVVQTVQAKVDSPKKKRKSSAAGVRRPLGIRLTQNKPAAKPAARRDRNVISVDGLEDKLDGGQSSEHATTKDNPSTLLMPKVAELRRRTRPAEQDEAERLSMFQEDNVQAKKAA